MVRQMEDAYEVMQKYSDGDMQGVEEMIKKKQIMEDHRKFFF